MGLPIAHNMLKAGLELTAYDVRPEPLRELSVAGARVAKSASEVGQHGELIGLSVVDDAQVEESVLGKEGILQTAAPGTIVAIHSTIHPRTAKQVAAEA